MRLFFFKIAWRNISRHKLYTAINVLGRQNLFRTHVSGRADELFKCGEQRLVGQPPLRRFRNSKINDFWNRRAVVQRHEHHHDGDDGLPPRRRHPTISPFFQLSPAVIRFGKIGLVRAIRKKATSASGWFWNRDARRWARRCWMPNPT